ncbi:MAG TPA: DNA mismatch repair endonuclease MutL [Anaerolineaceae bacterium]|nr:DNA mismatch repair endonuclease MutL [Anaerolineaceae bacterium]
MPIRLLPDEVASQIAAGEVIERPASVVKELLENSLDAGAGQCNVLIEGAGRKTIEISDDGLGIPSQEVTMAMARHATSKLSRAEDLFHIQTLGFRGEALASIGSVSHLTLTSRSRDEEIGSRVRVSGGRIDLVEQVGAPAGTVVRVEDLFFNVPARLKFLKSDVTERQQVDALVTRYALAYPQVRFKLAQDGRAMLQTSGNGNRREVLANLYGVETARQMLEVQFREESLEISGFISPLNLTRSNRREITFFINGRWVQSVPLTTALLQAYHTLLMVGRYPMAVMFVQMDPEDVDVNVHPAKAEVRFRSQDHVFNAMQRAIRRALLAYTPVPSVLPRQTWFPEASARPIDSAWEMAAQAQPGDTAFPETQPDAAPAQEAQPALAPALPIGRLPLLRLVGQIGSTYLVAEGPDGLYLIDQHAAHERVLFERMMRYGAERLPAQALLSPVTVNVPPASASLLSEQLLILEKYGFIIEPFGPATFQVRAVPVLLQGINPEAALRALIEDFEEDETPLQAELEARLVARICKRVAVKAGQTLSAEEQRSLVTDLEACQSPRTCPHGRPTMIHLSVDLLERQFGRRGAR